MTDTSTTQAEAIVRAAERALIQPRERECLLCYVARMLDELGCDNTLRFATTYRDLRAPSATGLERRLRAIGGFCDCEIFGNGFQVASRFWTPYREVAGDDGYAEIFDPEPPDVIPACHTVRRGSTQACAVWEESCS